MGCYTAFGLTICSELELPELPLASSPPDVTFRLEAAETCLALVDGSEGCSRVVGDGVELRWPNVGSFLIRHGREVVVRPIPGAEDSALRLFLLGPVMAVVVHQRGYLVLHASAVAFKGGAAIFLGESGQGKSTTAVSLHARGLELVTDDVAPIHLGSDGVCTILPGPGRSKLWPDSARALGLEPAQMARVASDLEKLDHRIASGVCSSPLPLARIYVLDYGAEPGILPLGTKELFGQLVRHTYVAPLLRKTGAFGPHLQQCTKLAQLSRGWRWIRPRSLAALPQAVLQICEHMAGPVAMAG